jgi:hypothetical protein
MARYGKAAQKSVKSAMRRAKAWNPEVGKTRKGWHGKKPQAGDCDWTLRSSQEGRQGTAEKIQLALLLTTRGRYHVSSLWQSKPTRRRTKWQFSVLDAIAKTQGHNRKKSCGRTRNSGDGLQGSERQ